MMGVSVDGCHLLLLALSIGQRLCVNFYVSIRANFLTTLRSHLDVTCSYYFWSSLFNVDDGSLQTLDKQLVNSTIS
jgi:hypothetical protein